MHYIVIFLCFPYFIVHITSKDLNRSCPPLVQNERCEFEQKFDTCQTNTDCKYGKICCPRKCGLRCIKKDQKQYNPSCPPYRTDVICKRFDRQCSTDKNCKGGQICCRVECGTVCKPGENIYLPTDICSLPKVTGPCKAYMPRYYYSKKVKKCLRFIYGGCEGNKNNFETLEQCKQRCEPEDPCPLPKCPLVQVPIGVCSRETFFDFDGVKCKGCPEILPCNKECLLPKDIGPCDADIKRHYYDAETKSCKEFRYGGCEGNKNNFITLEACKSSCRTEYVGVVVGFGVEAEGALIVTNPDQAEISDRPIQPKLQPLAGPFSSNDDILVNDSRDDTEPCPQVKCSNRCPYGFQTTTDGCPTCICTTKCPQGKPLPRLNCGLIPNPDKCPKGYFCSVDEIDRFAVCCRDPCFPPPRCPQPPRGPPGTCPPQCVYEYAIVNGKSCRVACKLGPVGPKGEPGKPCPPSLCSDGIAEPKPPPPRAPSPQKDRCDPPPRCPRPDRSPPGECPPKCIYEYETVNGKRCKVGCHLGEKGPLVQQGERCPPRMCQDVENEPIGPRDPVERTPSPAFIKRDNCPPNSDDRICYYYDRKCTDDSSCAKGKKCCKQGCSHVCVKSV